MAVRNLATDAEGLTSNVFYVDGATTTIIDTGAGFDLVAVLEERADLNAPEQVLLTHTHPDHVGNVQALRDTYDIPVFGFDATSGYVTDALADGDTVDIGDDRYVTWFTPGHAPDHLCFYAESTSTLFSGDLVFPNGGVGRTDLPGSEHDDLVASINFIVESVDDGLQRLYAGHGPAVTEAAYRHVEAAARFVDA